MIYTITLNPGIDRTLTVPKLSHNEVLRATAVRIDLGGKGLNVSRALQALGTCSVAMGFVGGVNGRFLESGLQQIGIETDFVHVAGETRVSTMIVEAASEEHVKVNEPGPVVQPEEQGILIEKISKRVLPGDYCVFCGSLPLGVPDDFYAGLIRRVKESKATAVLDTSGSALRFGCLEKPFLVKPNRLEAEQVTGIVVETNEDALRAARILIKQGVHLVALSLGAEGLLLVTDDETIRVRAPKVAVRNTVGAGDALLAGMLWALEKGLPIVEVARWGVATGSAAAMCEGSGMGNRQMVQTLLQQIGND